MQTVKRTDIFEVLRHEVGPLEVSENLEKKAFDADQFEEVARLARDTFDDEDLQPYINSSIAS